MVSFTYPAVLLLILPAVALAVWAKVSPYRVAARLPGGWGRIIDRPLQDLAVNRAGGGMVSEPAILAAAIWCLLVMALAQPTIESTDRQNFANLAGRIIVIDLGGGADVGAQRVAAAYLMDNAPAIPTAIVAASGDAYNVMPLTTDRRQIDRYLQVMDIGIMPIPGRDLQLALAHGEDVLARAGIVVGQVVLITGGTDPAPNPVARRNALRAVINVGDPGDKWRGYANTIDARLAESGGLKAVLGDLERALARVSRRVDSPERLRLAPLAVLCALACWLGLFRRKSET